MDIECICQVLFCSEFKRQSETGQSFELEVLLVMSGQAEAGDGHNSKPFDRISI